MTTYTEEDIHTLQTKKDSGRPASYTSFVSLFKTDDQCKHLQANLKIVLDAHDKFSLARSSRGMVYTRALMLPHMPTDNFLVALGTMRVPDGFVWAAVQETILQGNLSKSVSEAMFPNWDSEEGPPGAGLTAEEKENEKLREQVRLLTEENDALKGERRSGNWEA